jgi:predicted transposase YbfD/YdcC
VLAQRSVGRKTNEISAAAALIHPVLVKDRLISADAMHTQTKWCATVTAFGGDYLLFAKGNQPTLWQDLHDFFTDPEPERDEWSYARQVSKGHGRLEIRQIWSSTQMNDWFEPQWAGIGQVFCVHRQVSNQGKTREETAYGFTSLSRQRANADRLLTHIQTHWKGENRLHWRRDVSLGEDACQVYCQLMKIIEELIKKKDEGKKRSRRRGVDNTVLCRRFCYGDLIPDLEAGL